MITPLSGLVSALGLGGQLLTAATLLIVAVYIYRAQALARVFATLAGTVAGYALMLIVAVAVAIGLGWVDPHPSTMIDHLRAAVHIGAERLAGPARRFVGWIVDSVTVLSVLGVTAELLRAPLEVIEVGARSAVESIRAAA